MAHLFREDRRRSPSRTRGGYGDAGGSPHKDVRRVFLTVNLLKPTESFGLKCVAENGQVRIDGIELNGPTDRAGLQRNDIIESLNGHYVNSSADMKRARSGALQLGLMSIGITVFRRVDWGSPQRFHGNAFTYLTSPGEGSPVSTGTPEPNPRQSRQLGSLQAAFDNGALTRPEFEAAVSRIKGWDPWRKEPAAAPSSPEPNVVPPPALDQPTQKPDSVEEEAASPPPEPEPEASPPPPPEEPKATLTEEDRNNYPTIPPDTLASLKSEFVRMDTNGDGVLTDKELLRGLLAAGIDPESAHHIVMHALMFADQDGDGKIEYNEFMKFYGGVPDDDPPAPSLPPSPSEEAQPPPPPPPPPAADNKLEGIPPEVIDSLNKAFEELDQNGDGLISPDELHSFLGGGDFGDDAALIEEAFRAADSNGDGKIDYREFMKVQLGVDVGDPPPPPPPPEEGLSSLPPEFIEMIRETFDALDLNGDGLLTPDEINLALGGIDNPELVPIIKNIFDEADTDGDGKIDWKEFLKMELGG